MIKLLALLPLLSVSASAGHVMGGLSCRPGLGGGPEYGFFKVCDRIPGGAHPPPDLPRPPAPVCWQEFHAGDASGSEKTRVSIDPARGDKWLIGTPDSLIIAGFAGGAPADRVYLKSDASGVVLEYTRRGSGFAIAGRKLLAGYVCTAFHAPLPPMSGPR